MWPDGMERIVRCSVLGYRHRLHVASFFYLNGLPIQLLIELLQSVNPVGATATHTRKIRDLYLYWSDQVLGFERRCRYHAYSYYSGYVTDLNEHQRHEDRDGNVNNRIPANNGVARQRGASNLQRLSQQGYWC